MGNISSSCFLSNKSSPMTKLIFLGGKTQLLADPQLAGKIMVKNPDKIICDANSFFIGRPVPILDIEDELVAGRTYFVLPVDYFPSTNLTPASLSSSKQKQKPETNGTGVFPFEYVKGYDGRMMIRVLPEFIVRVISEGDEKNFGGGDAGGDICTTPELKKHYAQLVGSRERPWSPKLETVMEKKVRASPVRLLRLERR